MNDFQQIRKPEGNSETEKNDRKFKRLILVPLCVALAVLLATSILITYELREAR